MWNPFAKPVVDGRTYHIVIVDDNEVDRKIIGKALNNSRYHLHEIEDGIGLFHFLKSQSVDLILLDCHLQREDGKDICRQLKSEKKTENIPVVFLTGDDRPNNIVECYESEAENYLKKPVNAKILINEIEAILKQKD